MVAWLDFVRGAWRRLPVETVAVAAVAASLIAAVHGFEGVWVARVVLAGLLATPVAFALHGRGRKVEIAGGAAALVVAHAALVAALGDTAQLGRPSFMWPYGLTLLAAVLLPFVTAAPRFTTFVRRFFEQVTTWGLLWLGAVAALAVVFGALSELFGLPVKRISADVALVVTAGFVLALLGRLLPAEEQAGGRMPELWRRLATTVGAPFVSVMLVILVAYELWVLLRGELPRNVLSPLIMAAGFVGFGCTLIIAAVAGELVGTPRLALADPHTFTRRLSVRLTRAFPLVLLALLPMAAWALFQRVDQYGLTAFRVVRIASLACLAVLSLWSGARWWRGRAPLTWQVPAVIAGFALLTAFGPLSATSLAITSQGARLERLLTESGVTRRLVGAEPPAERVTVDRARHGELYSTVHELGELGGAAALDRGLDGDTALCAAGWSGASACLDRLGVTIGEPPPGERYYSASVAGAIATAGGRAWFVELERDVAHPSGLSLAADAVRARTASGATARVDLGPAISAAREERPLPAAEHVARTDDGTVVGRLLLRRLDVRGGEARRVEGVWVSVTE